MKFEQKNATPIVFGIPFENGIRMMQRLKRGVTGTAEAPAAIIKRLKKSPIDWECQLLDLQEFAIEISPENRDNANAILQHNLQTIAGHESISEAITAAVAARKIPVSLGGDHSLTYPLFRGVRHALPDANIALLYVDAHWDMRPPEICCGVENIISSGNSFYRLLEDADMRLPGKNMAVLGIHRQPSELFKSMENYARSNGVFVGYDANCNDSAAAVITEKALQQIMAGMDGVYLSLDIDAVSASDAPGVSAPADQGISRNSWLQIVETVLKSAPVFGIDIVEASSRKQHWSALFPEEKQVVPSKHDVLTPTVDLVLETMSVIAKYL